MSRSGYHSVKQIPHKSNLLRQGKTLIHQKWIICRFCCCWTLPWEAIRSRLNNHKIASSWPKPPPPVLVVKTNIFLIVPFPQMIYMNIFSNQLVKAPHWPTPVTWSVPRPVIGVWAQLFNHWAAAAVQPLNGRGCSCNMTTCPDTE